MSQLRQTQSSLWADTVFGVSWTIVASSWVVRRYWFFADSSAIRRRSKVSRRTCIGEDAIGSAVGLAVGSKLGSAVSSTVGSAVGSTLDGSIGVATETTTGVTSGVTTGTSRLISPG